MDLIRISSDMRKDCTKHQVIAERARARLDKHGVLEGEEDLRSELSMALLDLGILWKKYAKSFKEGTKGFAKLVATDEYVKENVVPDNAKRVAKAKAGCKKLGARPGAQSPSR